MQVYENLTDVTSYSYDSTKRELVSYDDPHIAQLKAQYVRNNGLGGSMFWDVSIIATIDRPQEVLTHVPSSPPTRTTPTPWSLPLLKYTATSTRLWYV